MFIDYYGGNFTIVNSVFSNIAFSATNVHPHSNSIFYFAPYKQNTQFFLNFQNISFNSDSFDSLGFYFSSGTLNISFHGINIENCVLNNFMAFYAGEQSTIYFGETLYFSNNTQGSFFFW